MRKRDALEREARSLLSAQERAGVAEPPRRRTQWTESPHVSGIKHLRVRFLAGAGDALQSPAPQGSLSTEVQNRSVPLPSTVFSLPQPGNGVSHDCCSGAGLSVQSGSQAIAGLTPRRDDAQLSLQSRTLRIEQSLGLSGSTWLDSILLLPPPRF